MYKIYKIKNKINSKKYIGMTSRDVETRMREHVYNKTMFIDRCMRQEGLKHFEFDEIFSCKTEEEARYYEKYFIILHDTLYPNGYNKFCSGKDALFINSELSGKQMRLI